MTRVFEQQIAGPVSRALVIGVGAYPLAKPDKVAPDNSTPQELRDVSDLPSAATGAALFADWLIANADRLSTPLASVDVLLNIGDSQKVTSAYSWKGRVPAPANAIDPRPDAKVDPPDTGCVRKAGLAWKADLGEGAGHQAIFFICGHGATVGPDSIVFLSDLNGDPGNPWGALLNVQHHARAFKLMPSLSSAFFFVDACGELIVDLVLQSPGTGAQFAYSDPKVAGEEKVIVLAAAAPKRLTYEGTLPDAPTVKAGRFTQCLIQALKGAAVRPSPPNGWVVDPHTLFPALKPLYRLRAEWRDLPFDPVPPMLPAERFPIIGFTDPPAVPVLVNFKPPQTCDWALAIHDSSQTMLTSRPMGPAVEWPTVVPASLFPHTLKGRSAESKAVSHQFTVTHGFYDHTLEVGA